MLHTNAYERGFFHLRNPEEDEDCLLMFHQKVAAGKKKVEPQLVQPNPLLEEEIGHMHFFFFFTSLSPFLRIKTCVPSWTYGGGGTAEVYQKGGRLYL